MSRRSLRLHTTAATDHYGHDPSLAYSASYSAGGASRRDVNRVLKGRRAQSLLLTPRKSLQRQGLDGSLPSCAASDASLLSSMLDESCIQERTMVDSLWGLDEDAELNESTMLEDTIILANGANSSAQTQTSMVKGHFCTDCTVPTDKKEAPPAAYPSSSKYSTSSSTAALSHVGAREHPLTAGPAPSTSFPASTTVYSRDRSRRHKTGLLASLWILTVCVSRRAVARALSLLSLLPLLYHNPLLRNTLKEGKGALYAACARLLPSGRAAAAAAASALTAASQAAAAATTAALQAVLRRRGTGAQKEHDDDDDDDDGTVVDRAHSSFCGSMNAKELATDGSGLNQNGSLCDDCKGEQRLDAHADPSLSAASWRSRSHRLLGALWCSGACAGSSLLWIGQKVGVASWAVSRQLLSALWLADLCPGKAAATIFCCLGTGCYRAVTLMSLLIVFIRTRCLPKLLRLLLLLLPFLLLLGLWSWGPSVLLSVLPSVNVTEWVTVSPLTPSSSSSAPEPARSPAEADGERHAAPFFAAPPSAESLQGDGAGASLHSERLSRLEQSLSRLWERVEGGGRRLEQQQQREEATGLYHALQEQLGARTDTDSMEPWVSGLLEERLAGLRRDMKDEEARREESRQQYAMQQEDQESRLAQLELLLQALVSKTEEVQKRQESFTPAPATTLAPPSAPVPVSMGVDRESHDALLAEVQRLEMVLGSVRQDLHGVMGCQGRCEVLDTFPDTVSSQVSAQLRGELRSLFYGSLQTSSGDPAHAGSEEAELPEALLPWLSERYVSGDALQAALAALELRILQNVSLRLQQQQQQQQELSTQVAPSAETLAHAVLQTAEAAGVTEEHVELIVRNALKLYSQDRTGLVDYALESGGGSILSTRCSETYETKTALMSLFGLPLWHFSQSPRTVIQPDVHAGNCWAFKGSSGYLVIRLSMKIRPSAFSLEHIPKALSPTGNISSAPRQFTVYGLDNENQEEGMLLGSYTYEEDGDALQTYSVSEENDQDYQVIEVRVLSNWGHQEYTCLYRFRVHGEPSRN